jgi:hypothetical protein
MEGVMLYILVGKQKVIIDRRQSEGAANIDWTPN